MLIHSNSSSSRKSFRIVVLGSPKCGKSAVTVRYLTRRYIGEYSSSRDFLYHHTLTIDGIKSEIEILDTAQCMTAECLYNHINWADAFVIVYSIADAKSFSHARSLLETIGLAKGSHRTSPAILVGNKRDLEHIRQVEVDEGQEMSLESECQFYEVSAAESWVGVSLAFSSLLREARPIWSTRSSKSSSPSSMSVSRMIGMVFGKNQHHGSDSGRGKCASLSSSATSKGKKKRPSLSI